MGLSRNPAGPLRYAVLGQIQEAIFFAPTQPPSIDARDTDIAYLVKIADRLDSIATRFLANPQLGWIILHRNDFRLAPNDLVPGTKIFIPTIASLRERGIVR